MPDRLLQREASLVCPKCGGKPYTLYRRQTEPGSAVFLSVLWPAHPDVPPPLDPAKITCPQCGELLVREH